MFRRSLRGKNLWAALIAARAAFRQSSSVATAEASTVQTWHSTDKYRRTVWQCNLKFKKGVKCKTPHLTEEEIKERFVTAWNAQDGTWAEVIENCRLAISVIGSSSLDGEIEQKSSEIEVLTEMSKRSIEENAKISEDQEAYQKRYNKLLEKYNRLAAEIVALKEQRLERKLKVTRLTAFIDTMLKNQRTLVEFDEPLWSSVVEKATVFEGGRLVFTLMNGTEIFLIILDLPAQDIADYAAAWSILVREVTVNADRTMVSSSQWSFRSTHRTTGRVLPNGR